MPFHQAHKTSIIDSARELKEIYLNLVISFFAVSMIDLFIPVYLLGLGYSLLEASLFWIVFLVFIFLSYPFSAVLSERIGVKHTILLSVPPLIVFYFLMYSLNSNAFPVLLLAALLGICKGIYWVPLNIDFVEHLHRRAKGKEVSYSQIAPKLGRVLGPIIGAFILLSFGFQLLFLFVIVFLFASILPLFTSRDFPPKPKDHWNKAFSLHSAKYFFGSAAEGAFGVFEGFFFPLFIFFLFGGFGGRSIYSMGFSSSLLMAATIIFAVFAGRKTDAGKGRQVLAAGSIIAFFSALAAMFASSEAAIMLVSFAFGTGIVLTSIPFTEYLFSIIRKQSVEGGLMVREAGLTLGRILPFAFFFLFGLAFPQAFIAVFAITAIAGIYFLLVKMK